MSKLNGSQIQILADYYARHFNAWGAWRDVYDAVKKHGNERKHYIYRELCKPMGTIIENYDDKFV